MAEIPQRETDPRDVIDSALAAIVNFLAYIIDKIGAWFTTALGNFVTWLGNVVAQVIDYLGNIFSTLSNWLATLFESISNFIGAAINKIVTFVEAAWQQLVDATVTVLDSISGYLTDAVAWVESLVSAALDTVGGWADAAVAAVNGLIDAALSALAEIAERVKTTVGGWIEALLELASQALAHVVTAAQRAIDTLFTGAQATIDAVAEKLGTLKTSLEESTRTLLEGLREGISEEFAPILEQATALVESFIGSADPDALREATFNLDRFAKGPITPGLLEEFWGEGWSRFVPSTGLGSKAFFALAALGGLLTLMVNTASIQAQVLQQDLALSFPWLRLPPDHAAAGWRRGAVERDAAVEAIQRHGFSKRDAAVMLDNTAILPADQDLLASWLRGDLTEESLDDAFFQRGYAPGHAARLKKLARIIPPVGDLITMAVREVFSPATAERFGQFEDFPEQFELWADKQGLSKEWARNYWAAHWRLPSAEQGFEMLHRGVIEDTDLDLLLKSLDVMPFWRDALKRIAFSPYTRVDIRRMHQLGILDDKAVHKAHLELGYDEEKATALTEFVIKLNRRSPAEDDEELGRLSRASVLGFFADGVLSAQRAVDLLVGMGHTLEAANLYVQSTELDKQRSERKAEAEHVIDLAAAGTITFAQAQDRLNGLGLTRLEVEAALTALVRSQEKLTKLPTRTEGERMLASRIISETDYRELLARLGYAPRWINAYVALAKEKASGDTLTG